MRKRIWLTIDNTSSFPRTRLQMQRQNLKLMNSTRLSRMRFLRRAVKLHLYLKDEADCLRFQEDVTLLTVCKADKNLDFFLRHLSNHFGNGNQI